MPSLLIPQSASDPGTLAVVADVALVVIAVAMIVLAIVAISIFLRVNKILGELNGVARESLGPVSDRARIISDNLEFITQALRTDVERLNSSVRALSDRLNQASEHMEERIEDFNALMEVVQGEAEEIFLDTAATVRGVREGARAIASPGTRRRELEPTPDLDDEDEAPEVDEDRADTPVGAGD